MCLTTIPGGLALELHALDPARVHHVDEWAALGAGERDCLKVGQDPLGVHLRPQVTSGEVEAAGAVTPHGCLLGGAPAKRSSLPSATQPLAATSVSQVTSATSSSCGIP